ncbi:MAG: cell division ATP-binding protein FtsE [Thiotrichales bacterium]
MSLIECRHLGKHYAGSSEALLDINIKIERSEFIFLTGHSGAGKSTLLKLFALIERPSRGSLRVNGHEVSRLPEIAVPKYRQNVGIIFQDHQLLPDRNVFENVALPLRIIGMEERTVAKRVRAALDKVGLLTREKASPAELSAGQQQRVGIARAVVNRPALLVADEPTGNLDPLLSAEIIKLFTQFNEVGVTVLIATHDRSLIRRFGQRILLLHKGQLKGDSGA